LQQALRRHSDFAKIWVLLVVASDDNHSSPKGSSHRGASRLDGDARLAEPEGREPASRVQCVCPSDFVDAL